MSKIVIYHANCADGWASAYICAQFFDLDESALRPCEYDKHADVVRHAVEDAGPDGEIYFVDFSIPQQELLALAEAVECVTVLDHHASAIERLTDLQQYTGTTVQGLIDSRVTIRKKLGMLPYANLPYVYLDQTECGATMCIKYCGIEDKRLVRLSEYVKDRDLWHWKLDYSRQVSAYLASLPHTFEAWDAIDLPDHIWEYVRVGDALLRAQSQRVKAAVASSAMCKIPNATVHAKSLASGSFQIVPPDGYYVGRCVNATVDHSEIGNELIGEFDFGMTYYVTKDGSVKVSVRSNTGIAKGIAERFGGGGHPNAAGFTIAASGAQAGYVRTLGQLAWAFNINDIDAMRAYGSTYTLN